MSNPTVNAGSQFNAPYNILPDLVYTNPTAQNNSQFVELFNINTNQENIISQNISIYNPTIAGNITPTTFNINTTQENIISQNISTYNPTIAGNITPTTFNINTTQENIISNSLSTYNPTISSQQFTAFNNVGINPSSIGLASELLLKNPTFNNNIQFEFPYNIDTTQENIISQNISIYNPTVSNVSQFAPPYDINTTQEAAISQKLSGYQHPYDAPRLNPNIELTSAPAATRIIPEVSTSIPINVTGSFTNLNDAQFIRNSFGYASSITAGALGVPQIGQSAQTIFNTAANFNNVVDTTYFTLPFDQLNKNLNFNTDPISIVNSIGNLAPITDFRSKRFASSFANQNANIAVKIASAIGNARKDGGSAALRGSGARALQYAAATLTPAGAYALFNLNGTGQFGYGWGDHDNRYALRSDFTLRSQISTKWISDGSGSGKFSKSNRPLDLATPFRGDKVTAIDFGRRLVKNAYQWLPSNTGNDNVPATSLTKDFIKFFLTGPSITAYNLAGFNSGNEGDADDIIVFRAILTQLSDSFSPDWTGVKMIGRADQNYQYNGYGRTVSIGFDIVITDRDEIKPTWRKLNALAGYCAPKYDPTSIALVGPWMRLTLGDLFHQTPVVMTSLGYTYELDHSWEINIEGDKEMFETPRKISVTCDFNVITDSLPQNNGRFFGLAKRYDPENIAIQGDDNWLSDFKTNAPDPGFNQTETR